MFCTFDGEMNERPPPWEYSSKSISSFCSFINSSQNKVIKTMTKENTNVFVVIKQQRTISTTYFYGKITATETESVKSKEKIDFALDEGEHDVKIDVTSQFCFCLCFFFVPMKFTQKRKKIFSPKIQIPPWFFAASIFLLCIFLIYFNAHSPLLFRLHTRTFLHFGSFSGRCFFLRCQLKSEHFARLCIQTKRTQII